MKDVTYTGPHGAVQLPNGITLPNGIAVSLDDKTADSLAHRADFTVTQPKKEITS